MGRNQRGEVQGKESRTTYSRKGKKKRTATRGKKREEILILKKKR